MISKYDFELNNSILDVNTYASNNKNINNYDNISNSDKFIFTNTIDKYIYGILLTYDITQTTREDERYTTSLISGTPPPTPPPITTPPPPTTTPAQDIETFEQQTNELYGLTNNPFKLSIMYNSSIYSVSNFTINTNYYIRNDPYIIQNNINTSTKSQYIFFSKPIIANKFEITVPRVSVNNSTNNKKIYLRNLQAYCSIPTQNNIIEYKREINTLLNAPNTQNVDICPSVDELVNKQNQVQQICDNLEYQDKVKSEKLRLEKNKQYLIKLQEQQKQIDQLNQVIQTLDTKRAQRDKTADVTRVLQYQQQKGVANTVRDLANQRLESQSNNQLYLDVNINSDPQS